MSSNIFRLRLPSADFVVFLDQCRKEKQFTDVQLRIGDKLFDAHRVVVSYKSPVLKAMVSDKWSTSKICPISGEYVDPSIVEELLHFLYTGSIDLTPDNVHPVCVAAHFLQIETLLEPSVQHLCQLISVDNVLTLFEFSLACELELLRDCCLHFIANKYVKVFQEPQICKLSFDNFKFLIDELPKQLKNNNILNTITKQRLHTFNCIVRWTEANISERFDKLSVLLMSIPLEELPRNFLTGTVSTHPLVECSISGSQAVSVAIASVESKWRTRQNLIVFGEDWKRTGKKMFRCFDWLNESWSTLPDLLEPRFNFDCTIFNKRDIVVSGGFKPNGGFLNSVEMFDWANQTWKKLADLPYFFHHIDYSLATLNGNLYAAGAELDGYSYRIGKTKLYCYSFETQQWKTLKSLNVKRERFFQLVGCGNHLYALGGGTDIVEKYDPLLDQWSVLEKRSIDLQLYSATVHLDKIYARGQQGDLKEFDPETVEWSSIPTELGNEDLVSMNGRLVTIAFDGYISEFDFSAQKWRMFFKHGVKFSFSRIIAGEFY